LQGLPATYEVYIASHNSAEYAFAKDRRNSGGQFLREVNGNRAATERYVRNQAPGLFEPFESTIQ
jgi:hypothetical protein